MFAPIVFETQTPMAGGGERCLLTYCELGCTVLIISRNEDSAPPSGTLPLEAQPLPLSRALHEPGQESIFTSNCELIETRKIPHNGNLIL